MGHTVNSKHDSDPFLKASKALRLKPLLASGRQMIKWNLSNTQDLLHPLSAFPALVSMHHGSYKFPRLVSANFQMIFLSSYEIIFMWKVQYEARKVFLLGWFYFLFFILTVNCLFLLLIVCFGFFGFRCRVYFW